MAFSLGYNPWLLLLCVGVAGGLTYWSYRSTIPPLGAGWRGLLGTLRFGALALLCFLLFEPVLRQIQASERSPVLAVLVDNSESLRVTTAGDAPPSAATARDSIRSVVETFDAEEVPGTTRFFTFDRALRSLSGFSADSLDFDGPRTDVAAALQAVPEALQGKNLRGIVLVSDGQYNTGRNPLRVAGRSPVPVHTVTVGDTTRRRDLRIRSVATNERAYLDSAVPVRVSLAVDEGQNERVTVTLERNGTVLDRADVRLPSGTAEMPVDLTFRPEEPGFRQLTVHVTELSDEATTRNNTQTVSLRVLESKRQVLLLGAAPSPNFTAIRRVYERDADTKVTARVPRQDGSFYGGALPEDLSTVDVVVCAGFPSTPVPADTVRRVAGLIDDGTPALFFLGRQTDLSAWTQHFSAALPATTSSANTNFSEAPFRLVESERRHPVFRMEEGDVSLFERLPPLQVSEAEWAPTPDAQVLATATRSPRSRSSPLLVLRRRAGHRTAAFLGTGVWRWALLPSDLAPAEPLWPSLASNLLRWVSTQDSDRPVRVQPVASTFEGGERVEFTGQVYDESMRPVSDATVEVTVTDSAGTDYPYTMDPVGQGRYTLDVGTLPEGTYRYRATARLGDTELGTDQGRFSVGRLRLEYQSTRADAVLMRQLATRSGGTAYTQQTVGRLTTDLANASSFSSEVVQKTSEAELWRSALFLVVILLLLASEWTLRKRFGLT